MTAPFIFIGTHKIREGRFEDVQKKMGSEFCEFVEENEPRLLAFNLYIDEERNEVSVVQVHPDADSMLFHMKLVHEHIESAYQELLDVTTSIQVFGEPNDAVVEMIKQLAGSGVPLTVRPQPLGGFTRIQGT